MKKLYLGLSLIVLSIAPIKGMAYDEVGFEERETIGTGIGREYIEHEYDGIAGFEDRSRVGISPGYRVYDNELGIEDREEIVEDRSEILEERDGII